MIDLLIEIVSLPLWGGPGWGPFLISHWLDITTTVLGLAYIILEYRASVWMWVVGFVMQALGIILFYQKGLYADCGMEFYYIAMTIYGFIIWKYGRRRQHPTPNNHHPISITHMPLRTAAIWTLTTAIIWGVIYYLLVTYTDSRVPVADSFTTALSIAGIWALARKYLEQWFVWIAVDVVSCGLYFYKDIPFKASLYGLYVVIAIAGYFKWKKMMVKQAE
ncbi:MAG: nicotinamide mononucleotide transporter [Prevotella sp.]|nr:nicotinamide mononucleotide transporter [Prevotella sp.]